jgi:hypothetical protein
MLRLGAGNEEVRSGGAWKHLEEAACRDRTEEPSRKQDSVDIFHMSIVNYLIVIQQFKKIKVTWMAWMASLGCSFNI